MRPREFRLLCQQRLAEANAEDAAERDRIQADPMLMDVGVDVLNIRMALRRLGLAVLGGREDRP